MRFDLEQIPHLIVHSHICLKKIEINSTQFFSCSSSCCCPRLQRWWFCQCLQPSTDSIWSSFDWTNLGVSSQAQLKVQMWLPLAPRENYAAEARMLCFDLQQSWVNTSFLQRFYSALLSRCLDSLCLLDSITNCGCPPELSWSGDLQARRCTSSMLVISDNVDDLGMKLFLWFLNSLNSSCSSHSQDPVQKHSSWRVAGTLSVQLDKIPSPTTSRLFQLKPLHTSPSWTPILHSCASSLITIRIGSEG